MISVFLFLSFFLPVWITVFTDQWIYFFFSPSSSFLVFFSLSGFHSDWYRLPCLHFVLLDDCLLRSGSFADKLVMLHFTIQQILHKQANTRTKFLWFCYRWVGFLVFASLLKWKFMDKWSNLANLAITTKFVNAMQIFYLQILMFCLLHHCYMKCVNIILQADEIVSV